jgi:capsular polysaccharide transport system ATP-binding protein
MIQLRNVKHGKIGIRPMLDSISINVPIGTRLGILATPGSGKSTLARILSGLQKPDQGVVTLTSNVSWPIGFAGFLHPHLTIEQNFNVLARLKSVDPARYLAQCLAFADIGISPNSMARDLTPTERAILGYSAAVTLCWDFLIADEVITVGNTGLRARCDAFLEQLPSQTGLVFLSRNPAQLKRYCDHHLVLLNGKLRPCPDLQAGLDALTLSQELKGPIHA